MEPEVRRFNPHIPLVTLPDFSHVVDGLRSSHIAMLHDRIVIELRFGQLEYIFGNVAPQMGILAVALGQCHRVADVVDTAIVGSQHEIGALHPAWNIRELRFELPQIFRGGGDVLFRIIHLIAGQPQHVGRSWHDLHQSLSPGKGYGLRVERRFLIALGSHQAPVPSDGLGMLLEEVVIMGNHATFLIEHRREYMTFYTTGRQQSLLFLFCLCH